MGNGSRQGNPPVDKPNRNDIEHDVRTVSWLFPLTL